MRAVFQNKFFLAFTLVLTVILSGCVGPIEMMAADSAFNPDEAPAPAPAPTGCYVDQYSTPDDAITRKIDILIVQDTSGSIKDERAAIATGFDNFLDILPAEVDYRIAVMNGHSAGTWSGSLYQKGTEPLILDSELHAIAQVKADLRKKMQNPATEGASDGGEMGLYSLMNGLNDNLSNMQSQGFFRNDAALAVIFVADENDICAEFPQGVVPVPDGQNIEPVAYDLCLSGGENQYLPDAVVAKLKEVQNGFPLVVGGVLYNNLSTIPLVGENELGYGYLETINAAGGITVDMANGDYGDGLQNLGMLATSSMMPQNEFNLSIANVDIDTIDAKVNGTSVAFTYMADLNQVHLVNPRDPFSYVNVSYCEKEEASLEALALAGGGFHNCAIMNGGGVKCWGRNHFGQLGYGDTNNRGDTQSPSAYGTIDLGGKAVQLSAGLYHTCALLDDGNVRCWGLNNNGQLGYGHLDNIGDDESPASAGNVSLGEPARKIFSGTFFNCAVLQSNNVRCWGDNNFGQLGLGNTDDVGDDELPSDVAVLPLGGKVVQMDLSTISNHTCAVMENDNLKCWGLNSNGQLGYGHNDNIGDDETVAGLPAVNVGGAVTSISTGNGHTCVLLGSGDVKCWGAGSNGQLGYASTSNINAPLAAIVNTGEKAVQLSAGASHTCALLASNNVMCWGAASSGQLGYGNMNNIGDNEDPVTAGYVSLPAQISTISMGANHSCAQSKDDGKTICWGGNSFGELGQGNTNKLGDDELPSSANYINM
jgi:alpha-tubulin suppressor-like RCC1 family protein